MSEETIFEMALQKPSGAERTSYLDQACHGDATLRQRVEALLSAHEQAGEFLEHPVVEQMVNAGALAENQDAARGEPSCGSVPSANALDLEQTRTLENLQATTDRVSLDHAFLCPTSRPDSIGKLGHYEILEAVGKGGFGTVYNE